MIYECKNCDFLNEIDGKTLEHNCLVCNHKNYIEPPVIIEQPKDKKRKFNFKWVIFYIIIFLVAVLFKVLWNDVFSSNSDSNFTTGKVLKLPTEEEIQAENLSKTEIKRRDSIANKEYQEKVAAEYQNLEETDDISKSKASQENVMPSRDVIEKQFNVWDGSHIKLTRLIKETMNDPESYEHVKTTFEIKRTYMLVMTEFRGKNSFGGKVKNTIVVKVDANGNVIELVSQY